MHIVYTWIKTVWLKTYLVFIIEIKFTQNDQSYKLLKGFELANTCLGQRTEPQQYLKEI